MKYDFNTVVDRRNTFCTQWDYTEDRFGNSEVLPFSISDMDFPLPPKCVEYLQAELTSGIYGYTRWRNDLLLDSITNWYDRRFKLKLKHGTITYSPTVIFSLSELIRMKAEPGDKVMLFTPAYDAFFKVLDTNGFKSETSMLKLVGDEFEIDKQDFECKIKDCKVLVFCSPHNPVGKVWSEQELAYIINICKQHNVYIISDEIHMDVIFEGEHQPIFKQARELEYQDNVALITSATKAFNFPGLLFSYVIIENKTDFDQFELRLKSSYGLSSCTILGMKATAYVYDNLEEWLDQLNDYLLDNINYVRKQLANTKFKFYKQQGTYLMWIDASVYDIEILLDIMYNQTHVGIMSGDIYGGAGYVRMNVGCPRSKVEEGCKRILQAIEILENRD